ncbi:fatty acid--CoA ligase family protein [Maritimibacter sp. HL-12]|uniref:ANL family adenylate-forming protein n=1 Tax=Maritimibacter sp. HL-12 TaxID=1162418 RepID=UPI0020CB2896|nr:fatty acid--CoA ligase family protein [Maritimibacter sp. HL-12]
MAISSRVTVFPDIHTVMTLTPSGSLASNGWMLASLANQGKYCFRMSFADAKRNDVDFVLGSPRQFQKFLAGASETSGRKIKLAYLSGAPVPLPQRKEILSHFETMRVGYGASETGNAITHNYITEENIEDMSLGQPLPWAKLEILDDTGQPVAPGETGFVRMKSAAMSPGYLDANGKDPENLRNGWFYSGDLARLNENGNLVLLGRRDDRLNIGGVKVDAVTIDNALVEFDGVDEGGAFIWTAPATGAECLAVAIAVKNGHDSQNIEERVRALCASRFEKTYVPEKVFIASSLPRNRNGKLQRNRIAESLKATALA